FGWHGSVSQGTRSAGLIGVNGIQSQFGDAAIAVGPSGGDTEFTWSEDGFSVSDATVDFFDQIAADLESNYCVDTSRIFTMGFSALERR
ncbi:MAG: hypothetical protein KUG77_25485, partial [Nannocystaceae bacterium]|nr:hypothetical protein [Nannocystaceae bacterium]